MAVPKRKTSRSVMKKRRSHHKLPQANFITCSNCQELILPHRVCPDCGYYYGKSIIEVKE